MKNFRLSSRRLAAAAAALAVSTGAAMAQSQDAGSMLTQASSTLKTYASPLLSVVSIILGLVGIIMLVPTFIKYAKGEPTSADAFIKHGGGLVIAFALLQLIRLIFLT